MINVVYTIKINKSAFNEIRSIIEEFDFKIKEEKGDLPANNIKFLKVSKEFHVDDLDQSLNLFQVLNGNEGVFQVTPIFITIKSKKYMVAVSSSSFLTFLTILTAIYAVSPETPFVNMLVASGLPAIVTFFAQIVYRHMRWH